MVTESKEQSRTGPWQPEEDQLLYDWQAQVGNKWSVVAQHIPGRTGQQCAQRWRHKVNPDLVHAPWTEEEDAALLALVQQMGQQWAAVARHIPGRSDQQCLGRWRRRLDPDICRGEWTAAEDEQLLVLHAQVGNSWAYICRNITGRTSQQCRGRFYQLQVKTDDTRIQRLGKGRRRSSATRPTPASTTRLPPTAENEQAAAGWWHPHYEATGQAEDKDWVPGSEGLTVVQRMASFQVGRGEAQSRPAREAGEASLYPYQLPAEAITPIDFTRRRRRSIGMTSRGYVRRGSQENSHLVDDAAMTTGQGARCQPSGSALRYVSSAHKTAASERSERTRLACVPSGLLVATPCNLPDSVPVPATTAGTYVTASDNYGQLCEDEEDQATETAIKDNSARLLTATRKRTPSVRRTLCNPLLFRSLSRRAPKPPPGKEAEPPEAPPLVLAELNLNCQQLPTAGFNGPFDDVAQENAMSMAPPPSFKRKTAHMPDRARVSLDLFPLVRWPASAETPRTPRPANISAPLYSDTLGSGTVILPLNASTVPPDSTGGSSDDGLLENDDPAATVMGTHPSSHSTPDSIVRILHSPVAACDLRTTPSAADLLFSPVLALEDPCASARPSEPEMTPKPPAPASNPALPPPAAPLFHNTRNWVLQTPTDQCEPVPEVPKPALNQMGTPRACIGGAGLAHDVQDRDLEARAVAAGLLSPQDACVSNWSNVPAMSWTSFQEARNELKELQRAVATGGSGARGWASEEPTPVSNHTRSCLGHEDDIGACGTTAGDCAEHGSSCAAPRGRVTPAMMMTAADLQAAFCSQASEASNGNDDGLPRGAAGDNHVRGRGSCGDVVERRQSSVVRRAFSSGLGAPDGRRLDVGGIDVMLASNRAGFPLGAFAAPPPFLRTTPVSSSLPSSFNGEERTWPVAEAAAGAPAAPQAQGVARRLDVLTDWQQTARQAPANNLSGTSTYVQRGFMLPVNPLGVFPATKTEIAAPAPAPASAPLVGWPVPSLRGTNYTVGPGARATNKLKGSPSKKLRISSEMLATGAAAGSSVGGSSSVGASPSKAFKSGTGAGLHLRSCSLGGLTAPGAVLSGPASPIAPRAKSADLGAAGEAAGAQAASAGPAAILPAARRACVPGYPGYGPGAQCQSLLAGFQRALPAGVLDRPDATPTSRPVPRGSPKPPSPMAQAVTSGVSSPFADNVPTQPASQASADQHGLDSPASDQVIATAPGSAGRLLIRTVSAGTATNSPNLLPPGIPSSPVAPVPPPLTASELFFRGQESARPQALYHRSDGPASPVDSLASPTATQHYPQPRAGAGGRTQALPQPIGPFPPPLFASQPTSLRASPSQPAGRFVRPVHLLRQQHLSCSLAARAPTGPAAILQLAARPSNVGQHQGAAYDVDVDVETAGMAHQQRQRLALPGAGESRLPSALAPAATSLSRPRHNLQAAIAAAFPAAMLPKAPATTRQGTVGEADSDNLELVLAVVPLKSQKEPAARSAERPDQHLLKSDNVATRDEGQTGDVVQPTTVDDLDWDDQDQEDVPRAQELLTTQWTDMSLGSADLLNRLPLEQGVENDAQAAHGICPMDVIVATSEMMMLSQAWDVQETGAQSIEIAPPSSEQKGASSEEQPETQEPVARRSALARLRALPISLIRRR